MQHIVIIGNGISGITSARWLRKLSDFKITVISSETDHFYSRTALMYIYMGHMRFEDTKPYEDWFWSKNKINLIRDHVDQILFNDQRLKLISGGSLGYDKLVLALGSRSNKFGWPGQDLNRVAGLYHYQDLENMEKYSNDIDRAVIVGGGLIGIEMAEMFAARNKKVSMLVRERSYWDNVLPKEESQMVSRHIKEHHIDLRLGVNLGEIVDDGQGNATAIIIKETGEKIDCQYVGLTAGVSPNVSFLKESGLDIEKGIMVNEYLECNIDHVYAIGDCAQLRNPNPGRRAVEAVWYTGRMMGETVAHNICGQKTKYDPGIWFNSAKFLDIEYQVYGNVPARLDDNQDTLYWEHADGKRSVRIVYDRESKKVIGFNLMGVRYRHEVCEKWIKEATHLEKVLPELRLANFDPEFCPEIEPSIIALYNNKFDTNLRLRSKRRLDSVLAFLKS